MTFDECLNFLSNNQEELSTEMPYLGIIEIMIGTTYRQLRMKGMTRKRILQLMLWGLFYFVQKENILTDKDEQVVIEAMQAAKANAYFVSGHREEEEE
jgi:hypothetical protein|nr:MAG TPA: hypothetical protein [Caudoviricetes sp.]